ncbi:hypothetical protein HUT06_34020 [Actinomadura sp. NAK00032]|uniref:hypothetical protein n=1 Tax=Actinomadura sp. NAK00032 TaxID=2742128 RepID=UPI00158FEAD2|nr:hypothetical protein [Actinomadura sp. NAK00032]QKW38414.1 hypothetical protein HUT06_34020 [Actinomadura sp. NAK00032]
MPEDELLAAVRRYDPSAERVSGKIKLRELHLLGPIALDPGLTAKARLPIDRSTAYIVKDLRPPRAAVGRFRTEFVLPFTLGMAHALDGTGVLDGAVMTDDRWFDLWSLQVEDPSDRPGQEDAQWVDHVASALLEEPVSAEEMHEVVMPLVGAAEIEHDEDEDEGFQHWSYRPKDDGPVTVECSSRLAFDFAAAPPLVTWYPALECGIALEDGTPPIPDEHLHQAGRIALAIAERFGGVPLDAFGFKIERPEHVRLRP